ARGRRAVGARRCRVMPTPAIPEYHARTPEAIDALERAVREHHRVALMRRGTEYVVVAERLEARGVGGGTEVLHGRLPMTGEVLEVEVVEREGDAALVLAELAKDVDAALVGRRGATSSAESLGATVAALIRVSERCVIVCGGTPSPMRVCAAAFDGRETSRRALD